MKNIDEKAKKIRLVIFDVDGVLTSGELNYTANGIECKEFHVHDGQGMKLLMQTGVQIGIITTCKSETIKRRMQDLNILHVYQGQVEKLSAYEDLKEKLNLSDDQIAYLGDDLPDLPILRRVGLPATVSNAPYIMQQHTALTTDAKGGQGAARELCDLIMQAQGTYESVIHAYLHT